MSILTLSLRDKRGWLSRAAGRVGDKVCISAIELGQQLTQKAILQRKELVINSRCSCLKERLYFV